MSKRYILLRDWNNVVSPACIAALEDFRYGGIEAVRKAITSGCTERLQYAVIEVSDSAFTKFGPMPVSGPSIRVLTPAEVFGE